MHQRIEKVKQHLKENRAVYITGSVCLTVGVVGGMLLTREINSKQVSEINQLLAYKSQVNVNQIQLVQVPSRRMHPGHVTRCNETGETFASTRRAAEALGLNRDDVSKQLAGRVDNVKGLTFEKLGEAKASVAT